MGSDRVLYESAKQAGGMLHVSIKVPSSRYFDEALRMNCFVDLFRIGVFPNAKEITESMATYNAVRTHVWGDVFDIKRRDVDVLIVGDGRSPRTGALFAMLSKWRIFSIDPELEGRELQWECKIRNLKIIGRKIEDCDTFELQRNVILLLVHSHADQYECLDFIRRCGGVENVAVVSIPCCSDLSFHGVPPVHDYHDWGCWSPKRRVMVWPTLDANLAMSMRPVRRTKKKAPSGLDLESVAMHTD